MKASALILFACACTADGVDCSTGLVVSARCTSFQDDATPFRGRCGGRNRSRWKLDLVISAVESRAGEAGLTLRLRDFSDDFSVCV